MLEKLKRKKKTEEKDWFPETEKPKKQKTKKKVKKRKPKKRKIEIEYLDENVEIETKKPRFLSRINRFIAAITFLSNVISGIFALTFSGGLFFVSHFFITSYIIAAYLWNTRRKKQKWD